MDLDAAHMSSRETTEGRHMTQYTTLRAWSSALVIIGVVSLIMVGFSAIIWAFEADGFWPTMGVIFIGAPIALFLASWPIALGQLMRAVADIGDRAVTDRGPVG
jgi:hypothetical protein